MSVFIIAECGSNWRFGNELENAYRMIRAAKECGADAAKFQWVSDYKELMKRRGEKDDEETRRIYSYVHFDPSWLPLLKAECDRVGIEFACTAYLPQDVAVIAPYVKRFKVAAREAGYRELAREIVKYSTDVIISNIDYDVWCNLGVNQGGFVELHCVSKYPCPIEEIGIGNLSPYDSYDNTKRGLSDHTAHVLTGAVAVGAGAVCIESHVRLHDTPRECPDYGHSLVCDCKDGVPTCGGRFSYCGCESEGAHLSKAHSYYAEYIQNIRTASRML